LQLQFVVCHLDSLTFEDSELSSSSGSLTKPRASTGFATKTSAFADVPKRPSDESVQRSNVDGSMSQRSSGSIIDAEVQQFDKSAFNNRRLFWATKK
jgi:hypothetical protein